MCNAPVTVLESGEGAAFGAALQALSMFVGESTDVETVTAEHLSWDDTRACEPCPSAVNFYHETYQQYERAVEKVAELYS